MLYYHPRVIVLCGIDLPGIDEIIGGRYQRREGASLLVEGISTPERRYLGSLQVGYLLYCIIRQTIPQMVPFFLSQIIIQ